MNNRDLFKMLGRSQGGEGVLLGDRTQISVNLVSHLFSHPLLHRPLWDHNISVG